MLKFLSIQLFIMVFSIEGFAKNPHAEGIAVHGNWCGPGHGGGEPIDVLDSICMQHDLCYQARIIFSCTCNREMIEDIESRFNDMGYEEQALGKIIAGFFEIAPCIDL